MADNSGTGFDDSSSSSSESDAPSSQSSVCNEELQSHMNLLNNSIEVDKIADIRASPIFTEPVRKYAVQSTQHTKNKPFTQYGLLAGALDEDGTIQGVEDPRVLYNITAPSSVFICGSQGSGKSHTLSCLLENCLIPSAANVLPRPLTGVVFHYDTFISDTGGTPCEAAYLASHKGLEVRVLCAPTNRRQMERIYAPLKNVTVEELRIDETDLNTTRMFDLMAINASSTDAAPLYVNIVQRILRELRLEQQEVGDKFNYRAFRRAVNETQLMPGQLAPLYQRLETLESFMIQSQTKWTGKKANKNFLLPSQSIWTPKAGRLTIVDLSCPCITAAMACSLFTICLSLFIEQKSSIGRVVALDEAHKYMTDSVESQQLTESLLSTIRLQRHVAARIFISTQEPTVSPKLLDLCSVTIVHRFTSPDWLHTLKQHLAGVSELASAENQDKPDESDDLVQGVVSLNMTGSKTLAGKIFTKIVGLSTGEALIFAPSATIAIQADGVGDGESHATAETAATSARAMSTSDSDSDSSSSTSLTAIRLANDVLKVRIRQRVTADGGQSIMAA